MPERVKLKKKTAKKSVKSKKTTKKSKAKKADKVVKKKKPSKEASKKKVQSKAEEVEVAETRQEIEIPSVEIENPPLEEIFAELEAKEERSNRVDEEQVKGDLPEGNTLSIKLSAALCRKIRSQAEDEGIEVEDFVTELLAEGVVLRAFEIVERKNQMRNPSVGPIVNRSGNNQPSGNSRGNIHSGSGGNQRKGHRGMSHGRYQSIMDDKATFLEYVRNQERSRR